MAVKVLDPITFEVIRHKLWGINDEAGATIRRVSGSPIATEAYDFNTGILNSQGDLLLIGVYISSHASVADTIIKHILSEYSENPGINEGDMFITNDPYSGALHQPDVTCVAPIHWQGELLAWSACTIHQVDIGGPVPGGWGVGARSIFEEAPPMPPIKIVEGGLLRKDLEREYLLRSRTPALVALDLRAKIASNNVTRDRFLRLVQQYGVETICEVMDRMVEYVEAHFRARLRELPDGRWRHVSFVEHDGVEDKVYPVRLTMTKEGDTLTFDFTESADQAPGLINACYSGMRGAVLACLLPFLCYDLPWTPAGVWRAIRVIGREGSIINARWPAGASMASIAAAWSGRTATNVCIGKMLASSEKYRDHAMAAWAGSWPGQAMRGINQRGEVFATTLLDAMAGGTGARTFKDGIDTGGIISALSAGIANVESNEYFYPMLYLYRKQVPDSGGAGKYRGGVTAEYCFTPHDTSAPITSILFSQGVEYPPSAGICGGYPASSARFVAVRRTNVWDVMKEGKLPGPKNALEGEVQVMPPKAATELAQGDVFICTFPGGGGFADPLDRDPALVLVDLEKGYVTPGAAHQLYGVVVRGGSGSYSLDVTSTEERRGSLRAERAAVAEGAWRASPLAGAQVLYPLGEYLELVSTDGQRSIRCRKCRQGICAAEDSYKNHVPSAEFPLQRAGPTSDPHHLGDDKFVLREFYCPGCWTLLEVEVNLKGEPYIHDVEPLLPEWRVVSDE